MRPARTHPTPYALIALALASILTACASTAQDPSTSGSEEPGASASAEPSDGAGGGPVGDPWQQPVAELLATAADEAGIDIDAITIVTAEEVTWSNGAIGCPEPGMGYTEALVPGYRVVLEIDGEERHFHAAQGGEFFECEDPEPPVDR
jgi:hypothetical protein